MRVNDKKILRMKSLAWSIKQGAIKYGASSYVGQLLKAVEGLPEIRALPTVAWNTTLMGITSIVQAKTLAAARYATYKSAREAGYRTKLGDVKVRRRADLDEWTKGLTHNTCFSEDSIKKGMP